MKTQVLLAATFAALLMNGASRASEHDFHEPPARTGAAGLSRAEVLADLQIWRRSGLAELAQREVPPLSTREYQDAAARYEAMRRAPEFAALVRSLGGPAADAVAAR